ncbi:MULTISPECIES: flavin reductase family protein [Bacillus]|uniref:Flavin reductase like domain-containing protein n=2 Tax=Bacillus TaxID=1386 RepID=A0A0M3RAT2_9BACI|nr:MULTISPECIES: flavin reductase family protein [Bacillus]ALC83746.1 hypothetical protein AM592_21160 [Bacillus gobiensis]MBP1083962.1 flavin reductase (DIM6/NTAB) family NADH-FMN oxidoreductase RutF [Bacillus capparidis]MED1096989.1 flavin reductase family protein [Bacillus capparidis]
MYKIDANDISAKDNYKILSGSVIPRPIAFVSSISLENQVVNAAPFSFFNVVSSNPPLLSISVQRINGEMKDTARNITNSKEFVIHLSDESIIEEINKTAASLPQDESELEQTSLSLVDSEKISVPGIREAKIRFECRLEQHLTFANDHNEETTDLIIGRVLCYHLHNQVYDPANGYILSEHLAPVCRLAGNDYAALGKKFTIERPL